MALTKGVITVGARTLNSVALSATAATLGTAPYTYQWYRSLVPGFTPGGGNILAGKTALTLADTGLVPSNTYYYVLVATDDAATPDSVDYDEVSAVTSQPSQNPNQFGQASFLGMVDLRFSGNTIAVMIDAAQETDLTAGDSVKMVDSAGGVPKVLGCDADDDEVLGFINYDIKTQAFVAGSTAEISIAGNCMYMYAAGAIARGVQVCLSLADGGVEAATGSSANTIVGWAYDKAAAAGSLIRVMITTPSFLVDS